MHYYTRKHQQVIQFKKDVNTLLGAFNMQLVKGKCMRVDL